MSGGHFGDYCYFQVSQFARDLEEEILNNNKEDEYGYVKNYSPETIEYLEGGGSAKTALETQRVGQ